MFSNNNFECHTNKAIEYVSEKEIVTRVGKALENKQFFECERIMNDVDTCVKRDCTFALKIMKKALDYSTNECFIYLFDKLSNAFNDEDFYSLLHSATNYGNNYFDKFSYLVNHDMMEKLCCGDGHELLAMSYQIHNSKFLRFLHSKFMNKNVFDLAKIKGIPILEYMFLSAGDADMCSKNPKISLRFILGQLRTWETNCDNAILSVIELGFASRESFVQTNGEIYGWFHTINEKIYKTLVEKQFLIGDELLIYHRKEHYVKYRIVLNDIEELRRKKNEIYFRQNEICLLQEEIKQRDEYIKKLFKSSNQ